MSSEFKLFKFKVQIYCLATTVNSSNEFIRVSTTVPSAELVSIIVDLNTI